MDKMGKQQQEHEMKLQLLQHNQKAADAARDELADARAQLDRAQAELMQLSRMQRSTTTMGETWEQQYRTVLQEMEACRDENASLKSKIRRQYKQIELLTREFDPRFSSCSPSSGQNSLDDSVSELENSVGRVQGRFDG